MTEPLPSGQAFSGPGQGFLDWTQGWLTGVDFEEEKSVIKWVIEAAVIMTLILKGSSCNSVNLERCQGGSLAAE